MGPLVLIDVLYLNQVDMRGTHTFLHILVIIIPVLVNLQSIRLGVRNQSDRRLLLSILRVRPMVVRCH